jgi:hypothetical protein
MYTLPWLRYISQNDSTVETAQPPPRLASDNI